jgi:hypothetical protein
MSSKKVTQVFNHRTWFCYTFPSRGNHTHTHTHTCTHTHTHPLHCWDCIQDLTHARPAFSPWSITPLLRQCLLGSDLTSPRCALDDSQPVLSTVSYPCWAMITDQVSEAQRRCVCMHMCVMQTQTHMHMEHPLGVWSLQRGQTVVLHILGQGENGSEKS